MIRCCDTGFNRYIVECKYIYTGDINAGAAGFNRYIVECKFSGYGSADEQPCDLIDT